LTVSAAQEPAVRSTPSERGFDRLLELQELDLAIDRLRARLAQLESGQEVGVARQALSEAEARLGELRLQIDEVSREQGRMESDVDSLQRKKDAERTRLYDGSVANPKELQSIEHEVANLARRKESKEDELLERMERLEELESGLGKAEGETAEARRRLAEIEEGSGNELVEIERALQQDADERGALTSQLDEKLLTLYEDLRPQKKGVAAVALEAGVCQGCHQKLSAVYLDRLKRDEGIRRCEYCRRILVLA
jgi:uncharacterized protein